MKDFSFKTRVDNIQKLKTEHFDILIIGGGITGAGVARDAALRGLKVGLIEANDYAFGTSSRSSKLIHGGIRYLENLDFKLVFEALSERSKLFEIAPHLVHPLRFMIPLFKDSRVGMFKMGLGMFLYDMLALFQVPEMHERLNPIATRNRMPVLRYDDLAGSYVYSDAYMDDDRLVIETLRAANEAGAVCVNYVKALKSNIVDGKVKSIEVHDLHSDRSFNVSCDQVVCTVGPWTDLVGEKLVNDWKKILRPTKGVHLTLPKHKIELSSAVVMAAQESNRIVFAIPRHEMTIIGTTDTDFKDEPQNASADFEDVDYLLNITNSYFPSVNLSASDIISSYVGVRPLVKDDSGNEGKTSREHVILNDKRGFHFVAGGKYTTYRLMSEQIVDAVLKALPIERRLSYKICETTKPLNIYTGSEQMLVARAQVNSQTESRLVERFGLEAFEILRTYGNTLSYWQLEAMQAIQQSMCMNLLDFYTRRTPLILAYQDHGLSIINDIASIFKKELILTNAEIENQKNLVFDFIKNEYRWRKQFAE
ncbi:MAG: glycerol-3-phosphate dehydrogenase/oxidase [Pseudobdellovibrio sp.]